MMGSIYIFEENKWDPSTKLEQPIQLLIPKTFSYIEVLVIMFLY